jgi:hypothetical protein
LDVVDLFKWGFTLRDLLMYLGIYSIYRKGKCDEADCLDYLLVYDWLGEL